MRKRRRDDTKKQNKKEEFYKLKTNKKAFSNDFVTLQNGKGKLQKLNRLYLGKILLGGRHSSVDSSVPTNLRSRVQIPNTPSTLIP